MPRGRSREDMRKFILDELGEHPEGLTTVQLMNRFGLAEMNARLMLHYEIIGLRIHYHISLEQLRPGVMVNAFTPSAWLKWAKARQEEEARGRAQSPGHGGTAGCNSGRERAGTA